MTVNQMKV